MPNWCNNDLVIEGSPKELNKLMKQVEITKSEETEGHRENLFSCHKVIPMPENVDWYNWSISEWGSKWDLSDVWRSDDWESGVLRYSFQTAWSPVLPVIEELAKQFPKVTMTYTYWEGGMDYWGEYNYEKGEQVSTEGGSLNDASCERLDGLMGDHHQCRECYSEIECSGEDTPELCEECEATLKATEEELWEEKMLCANCDKPMDYRNCPTEVCKDHFVCPECGADIHKGERLGE